MKKKKIIYIYHLKEREILRGVTDLHIQELINNPTETIISKQVQGRFLSYIPFDFNVKFQTQRYLELVHTDKDTEPIYIISVIIKTRGDLIRDGFTTI